MPIHQLVLAERKEIARGTFELLFKKPDNFNFKPGQYGGFTLTHAKDLTPENTTRRFSLASAPHDDHITITTRMQPSAYKQALMTLVPGQTIKFAGPIGNFVLDENVERPAVFIAGGIGITPFYSMIKHALHTQSPQKLTLFYGNQSVEDAAYLAELQQLSHAHPSFTLVSVLVETPATSPHESGYISDSIIKKHIPDLTSPMFYICGSPAMVNALHNTLKELDINADQIKIEDFPGY